LLVFREVAAALIRSAMVPAAMPRKRATSAHGDAMTCRMDSVGLLKAQKAFESTKSYNIQWVIQSYPHFAK